MRTWYDVSCTSEKNPSLILELLMEAKEVRNLILQIMLFKN